MTSNSFQKDQSYQQIDLSGKLIIKVQLGEDVRRIPIHNEALTYDELVLMMQRVFRGKLTSSDEITIKYKDEDGDLITIFDSSDLAFAIQYSRVLKLTVLLGGDKGGHQPLELVKIRKELRSIRDQVNHLLDIIEPRCCGDVHTSTDIGNTKIRDRDVEREGTEDISKSKKGRYQRNQNGFSPWKHPEDENKQNGSITSQASSKEFDPLQGEDKSIDEKKSQQESVKDVSSTKSEGDGKVESERMMIQQSSGSGIQQPTAMQPSIHPSHQQMHQQQGSYGIGGGQFLPSAKGGIIPMPSFSTSVSQYQQYPSGIQTQFTSSHMNNMGGGGMYRGPLGGGPGGYDTPPSSADALHLRFSQPNPNPYSKQPPPPNQLYKFQ